ncbi:hypothetical protein [Gracilibacillus thailandensis]|uniref:Uncharacterized protein n=1 Tax=Gracilibacillus thailandensis TaxID=563735 RepID=A0A6N7QYS2_9BACI|nr:hypothetical protein [Gracilibacillus thailandensis]MRI66362.1 hypothetical protein [Gracilibacillus thailandensis]
MSVKRFIITEIIYSILIGFVLGLVFDNFLLGMLIAIGVGAITIAVFSVAVKKRNKQQENNSRESGT